MRPDTPALMPTETSRADSTADRRTAAGRSDTAPSLDPDSDGPANEILQTVRELLALGRLTTARGLVARGLRRFPDHAELSRLGSFLDLREAQSNPLVEPSTSDEIDWLTDPPESARGRWVALIGRQVVAMADSARELKEALRSLDLAQRPLIHRVAP